MISRCVPFGLLFGEELANRLLHSSGSTGRVAFVHPGLRATRDDDGFRCGLPGFPGGLVTREEITLATGVSRSAIGRILETLRQGSSKSGEFELVIRHRVSTGVASPSLLHSNNGLQ